MRLVHSSAAGDELGVKVDELVVVVDGVPDWLGDGVPVGVGHEPAP